MQLQSNTSITAIPKALRITHKTAHKKLWPLEQPSSMQKNETLKPRPFGVRLPFALILEINENRIITGEFNSSLERVIIRLDHLSH